MQPTMFKLGALPMEGKKFFAAYNICCVHENFLNIMFARFVREERHTLNVLDMSVWTIKQQLLDRHIQQDQQIQTSFLLLMRLCTYNSKHSSNIGLSVFFCTFVCCSEQCENIFLGSSSMITKGSLKPAQNSV
jgi:hypothetical protein